MVPATGGRGSKRVAAKSRLPERATDQQNGKKISGADDKFHTGPRQSIPITLQQNLLNIFMRAFPDRLSPTAVTESLKPLLQEVKSHLYDRDFEKAFGRPDYLEAYAVRWSASRSLGYLHIFDSVMQYLPDRSLSKAKDVQATDNDIVKADVTAPLATNVTCLGGGAGAELCGLAGIHSVNDLRNSKCTATVPDLRLCISLIDVAQWESVCSTLYHGLTTAPPVSAYASAAVKAANSPLIPNENLQSVFHLIDVLGPAEKRPVLNDMFKESSMITIMFTLNELYSTSLAKTQNLLLNITAQVQSGTLLLVVDSPGSYSTVQLNDREKKYPMSWLLDHTLLTVAPAAQIEQSAGAGDSRIAGNSDGSHSESSRRSGREDHAAVWEKLTSDDSVWFRIPENLKYPLELENMRYQMHLFRRL